MKSIAISFFGLFCIAAVGAQTPSYPPSFNGTILSSMTERGTFEFTAGTIGVCEHTDIGASMTVDRCKVSGTGFSMKDARGNTVGTFVFTVGSVFAFLSEDKIFRRRYIFQGVYQESGVAQPLTVRGTLVLRTSDANPTYYTGSIELPDLDVKSSLVGQAGVPSN
jgi:hypothetical protein